MNFTNNPELLDRLSASYALGNLRAGARRRFTALSRQNPRIRASALLWQERISGLTELSGEHPPSPDLWIRIENLVSAQIQAQHNTRVVAEQNGLIARLGKAHRAWKMTALLAGAATTAAGVFGISAQYRLQAAPQLDYVAVLADDKSAASMLVTFDPKHQRLTLKRVSPLNEGEEKSLQLWALPTGGAPQSLGVLDKSAVVRLPVQSQQVQSVPTLAISLEPRGGVPSAGGPTGPVLYKGALLQTPL
jgi:anti-sigma-K factor RskA